MNPGADLFGKGRIVTEKTPDDSEHRAAGADQLEEFPQQEFSFSEQIRDVKRSRHKTA
jgi:hypothetical protein